MLTRSRKSKVTFARPFKLDGVETLQPAGIWDVEVEEELLDGLSFPAYRRTGTWIRLAPQPGQPSVGPLFGVQAEELETALAADRAATWAAEAAAPATDNQDAEMSSPRS